MDVAGGVPEAVEQFEDRIDQALLLGREVDAARMIDNLALRARHQRPTELSRAWIEKGVELTRRHGLHLTHIYCLAYRSRLELDEGELDRLVDSERLAEGLPDLRIRDRLVDAVLRRTEARRRLADAVLVEEVLHDLEATALAAEDRLVRHPHVGEGDAGMVGRHVERPEVLLDLESAGVGRDEERGDAVAVAGVAAGAGEDQIVGGGVHAGVPGLLAVDAPAVSVTPRARLHVRRVRAVLRLGDPEREAERAVEEAGEEALLLRLGAVLEHQEEADVVADDRVLGLQITVETEPLGGEVLADDRHPQVRAVPSAVLPR